MKTNIKILFVLVGLIFLTACGLLGQDESSPIDISGKIVFSAEDSHGIPQIYTMKANGTDLKRLTHFTEKSHRSGIQPAWSPNGSRIAFASYSGLTLGTYLMVMNADGSNMHLLKSSKGGGPVAGLIGSDPSWSPDGSKIAYQVCLSCEAGGNPEIFYVTIKGNTPESHQVHRVTENPASDMHPTWSPHGKKIVFSSNRAYINADTLRFREDLYEIDEDGNNIERLIDSESIGINISTTFSYNLINSDQFIYSIYNINTGLEKLMSLNFKTGNRTLLNKYNKSILWVFWDSGNRQLITINKKDRELPVIISILDLHGNILKRIELKNPILRSALGFDFSAMKNN